MDEQTLTVDLTLPGRCPRCQSADLVVTRSVLGSYLSGLVTCRPCAYRRGFKTHVVEALFAVQPLPIPPALVHYSPATD